MITLFILFSTPVEGEKKRNRKALIAAILWDIVLIAGAIWPLIG